MRIRILLKTQIVLTHDNQLKTRSVIDENYCRSAGNFTQSITET